jgi:hypothetical protein
MVRTALVLVALSVGCGAAQSGTTLAAPDPELAQATRTLELWREMEPSNAEGSFFGLSIAYRLAGRRDDVSRDTLEHARHGPFATRLETMLTFAEDPEGREMARSEVIELARRWEDENRCGGDEHTP